MVIKMIKNIIFDIGNVLVAFRWKEFFHEFGYEEEIVERICKATVLSTMWQEYDRGVLSDDEILDGFIQNDPGIEQELRETLKNIDNMLAKYEYAIPWIKELKDKGYKVYYLSNFSKKAYVECGQVLDFLPFVDGGIFSYKVKQIKPDAAIYNLLLEKYNLVPEECVFLDDIKNNVDGAFATGMHGIWFQNKEQAIKELEILGVN